MSALKAGNYPGFLNQCTCEELKHRGIRTALESNAAFLIKLFNQIC